MFEAPSAIEEGNGTEETENTQVNSDVEADVNFNRESIGKRAIEDLASQLNKAANTIRDFSQNVSLFLDTSRISRLLIQRQTSPRNNSLWTSGVWRGDIETAERRTIVQTPGRGLSLQEIGREKQNQHIQSEY